MKYNLVGQDGNAFSLIAYTTSAMKKCGFSKGEILAVQERAFSGDYDNLLCILDEAIDKCNKIADDE
jgi:hypothetical protein